MRVPVAWLAPGVKFADEKNSASVRLLFKSAVKQTVSPAGMLLDRAYENCSRMPRYILDCFTCEQHRPCATWYTELDHRGVGEKGYRACRSLTRKRGSRIIGLPPALHECVIYWVLIDFTEGPLATRCLTQTSSSRFLLISHIKADEAKITGPVCRLRNVFVWLSSVALNYAKPSSQSQRRRNPRALWWLLYCPHIFMFRSHGNQISLRVYKCSAAFLSLGHVWEQMSLYVNVPVVDGL